MHLIIDRLKLAFYNKVGFYKSLSGCKSDIVETERQKHRSRAFRALKLSIRAISSKTFDFEFSIRAISSGKMVEHFEHKKISSERLVNCLVSCR